MTNGLLKCLHMPIDPELESWLRLVHAPGMGRQSLYKLLNHFGSPEAVLNACRDEWMIVTGKALTDDSPSPFDIESYLAHVAEWLADPGNRLLTLADSDYPQALLEVPSPPPLLYAKGAISWCNHPAFAIVGSRNATGQGKVNAQEFAHVLSDAGLTIVSGLALGIDAAAHRGGLNGASRTIAVVGTGLDTVYPSRNHDLAHSIAAEGLLLSEFPLGTPPLAANFPRRNRLIAALGKGCLVVEAAVSSGSLITARLAGEQGREVFAIPGSIHSPLSKGCHALIRQGAKLVENAGDILEELQFQRPLPVSFVETESPLPSAQPDLLSLIGFEPVTGDTLIAAHGFDAGRLASALTMLELEGHVEQLPGGYWQRVS